MCINYSLIKSLHRIDDVIEQGSQLIYNFRFVLRRFLVNLIIKFVDIEIWESTLPRRDTVAPVRLV